MPWIVVEAEDRPGVCGGTELLAIQRLKDAGFETFWPHYRHEAEPHHGPGWRAKGKVQTLRGLYPPFLFAAIDGDHGKAVRKISDTRYVSAVLWSEHDRHYLDEAWMDWLKSDQPHPEGKPRVRCIDPEAGLFELPDSEYQGRLCYQPGTKVRVRGSWEKFESEVLADTGKSIRVRHAEMFGKSVTATYDPVQVERI